MENFILRAKTKCVNIINSKIGSYVGKTIDEKDYDGLLYPIYPGFEEKIAKGEEIFVKFIKKAYPNDFDRVFEEQPVYIFGFSKGAFRQCRDVFAIYDNLKAKVDSFFDYAKGINSEYKKICRSTGHNPIEIPLLEELTPIELTEEILPWEHGYIDSLNSVDNKEIENIYGSKTEIVKGVIGISCGYMNRAIACAETMGFYLEEFAPIMLAEDGNDLFENLFNLRIYAAERGLEQDQIIKLMKMLYKFITQSKLFDSQLVEDRWSEYENHDFEASAASFDEAKVLKQAEFKQTFEHICERAGREILR